MAEIQALDPATGGAETAARKDVADSFAKVKQAYANVRGAVEPGDPAEQPQTDPNNAKDPFPSLVEFAEKRQKAYHDIFGTTEELKAERQAAEQKRAAAEATSEQAWGDVTVPALARLISASRIPAPEAQQMLPQPPVPSQAARPFMDVSEKNSLSAMVTTLGVMAQMAMAGKAPVAALGALTGALEGWNAGDKQRADREWRHYLGEVDRIQNTNKDNIAIFDMAMKRHTTNLQAAQAEVIASLHVSGRYEALAQVARDGVIQTNTQLRHLQDHIDKIWGDAVKIEEARAARDLKHTIEMSRFDEVHRHNLRMEDEKGLDRLERRRAADQTYSLGKERLAHTLAQDNQPMSEELANALADQYRAGEDPSKLVRGIGKKATADFQEIQKRALAKDKAEFGTTGDIVAARRNLQSNTNALKALAKQQTEFQAYLVSFDKTVQNALGLAEKLNNTNAPKWTRFELQMRADYMGDEDAKNMISQMTILAREVDRVVARGKGPGSDKTRQDAGELMNPGMTFGQFKSLVTNVLSKDALYAAMGFEQERKRLLDEIAGGRKTTGEKGTTTPDGGRELRVRLKSNPATTGKLILGPGEDLPPEYEEVLK